MKWKSIIPYTTTGRLTMFGKADMRANKMTNNACFYLLDYGLYFSNSQWMKWHIEHIDFVFGIWHIHTCSRGLNQKDLTQFNWIHIKLGPCLYWDVNSPLMFDIRTKLEAKRHRCVLLFSTDHQSIYEYDDVIRLTSMLRRNDVPTK